MPRKKIYEPENQFDYLEKKFGATPAQILQAVELVGPYRARLETYFSIKVAEKKKGSKKELR